MATAAAVLRGLHDAGTLEVAYGGGEPFAFSGFAELVAELGDDHHAGPARHHQRHAAPAGDVVALRRPLRPGPGLDLRRGAVARHRRAPRRRRPALGRQPDRRRRGAARPAGDAWPTWRRRGCHDVSLLSYVGPEAGLHLDAAGDRRLAAIIEDSPVTCRLSVCFGDRVAVPRLHGGDDAGDCGAGRDFVSITPDRRVQSCSFQDRSLPGATAAEILAAWRLQQPALAAPSPRRGCARLLPMADRPAAPPPIAIWQSFSGNNSGECLLVATFRDLAGAEAYLAELVPGWVPDGAYSPAWRQLFEDEGVLSPEIEQRDDDPSPRELVAIGRSVIAATTGAGDNFPELRALAWKRGAFVVPGGVHIHDEVQLLLAVKVADEADRAVLVAAPRPAGSRVELHGDVVLLIAPVLRDESPLPTLVDVRDAVAAFAGERRFALELFFDEIADATLTAVLQRLGHRPARHPRLFVSYWGATSVEQAAAFAHTLPDERTTVAGDGVLVDPAPDRKRLAVLAYRRGGTVRVLDGARVQLWATMWYAPPPPQKGTKAPVRTIDDAHVEAALRASLPRGSELTVSRPEHDWRGGPSITIVTDAPAGALRALGNVATSIDARLNVGAEDLDPLGCAMRRLLDDLRRSEFEPRTRPLPSQADPRTPSATPDPDPHCRTLACRLASAAAPCAACSTISRRSIPRRRRAGPTPPTRRRRPAPPPRRRRHRAAPAASPAPAPPASDRAASACAPAGRRRARAARG